MMNTFLRKQLKDFTNYKVQKIEEKYVINANESPNNPLDNREFKSGILALLENMKFNLYPDPSSELLREDLAEYLVVHKDEIIVGNGADEIITYIMTAFLDEGDYIITHSPTFEMYKISATIRGGRVYEVQDKEDYRIDTEEIIYQANKLNAKIVFLCLPNNPTGYMLSYGEVCKIIDETKCLVVLDEAYIDFSERNHLSLLSNDRVIILRTFSKAFGLAGLRVGYGIGSKEIIENIGRVKAPYNLNSLTQSLARIALENREDVKGQVEEIVKERKRVKNAIEKLKTAKSYDAHGNFILVKSYYPSQLVKAFKDRDILVKFYGEKQNLEDCFRLTLSSKPVNDMIIDAFNEVEERYDK